MQDNIIVFEDENYKDLYPFSLLHPTFDLKCGVFTTLERIFSYFPEGNFSLICRDELTATVKEAYSHLPVNSLTFGLSATLINSNFIMNNYIKTLMSVETSQEFIVYSKKHLLAAKLVDKNLDFFIKQVMQYQDIHKIFEYAMEKQIKLIEADPSEILFISYIWDLINHNPKVMEEDFKQINKGGILKAQIDPFTSIIHEEEVFIDTDTIIEPFCVLDATDGPILIEKNVHIKSHSRIVGPVHIGANSVINSGSITSCSIGPFCKLGGEISNSIFLGFSSKQHEGFLGHSYVGEWVNLGALTTTSNLKNNYSLIKMEINKKTVDTNCLFLGSLIGDYSKFAIGSLLNSGSVFGVGCNLFAVNDLLPKAVKSFTWLGNKEESKYKFDKFIQTSQLIYLRRNLKLTESKIKLLEKIYNEDKPKQKSSTTFEQILRR